MSATSREVRVAACALIARRFKGRARLEREACKRHSPFAQAALVDLEIALGLLPAAEREAQLRVDWARETSRREARHAADRARSAAYETLSKKRFDPSVSLSRGDVAATTAAIEASHDAALEAAEW